MATELDPTPDDNDANDKTAPLDLRDLVKTPSQRRSAYFIVIDGESAGRMYKLSQESLVMGRAQDADLVIDDASVSRNHAELKCTAENIVLTDLGSTNGVFVNGKQVEQYALRDGDLVQIGSTTILKFSYQDELEERFQRQLYESATRDGLTGAFNKKFFHHQLELEISYTKRHRRPFSLLLLDFDNFKAVNDNQGHLCGDFVLQETASLIAQCVRQEDVFCRYGGEEFGVILRDTTAERAFLVAERIRRDVESHLYLFQDTRVTITISVGTATMETNTAVATADELISLADAFLYKAKKRGRNRTESQVLERDNQQQGST